MLAPPAAAAVQRCGDHTCDCSPEEQAAVEARAQVQRLPEHPAGSNAPLSVQRDFLTDAWRGLTAAGPAIARAARLVADAITSPSQLPAVLAAIGACAGCS
ncbi:hypothetical protein [Glycomyces tarimensis]